MKEGRSSIRSHEKKQPPRQDRFSFSFLASQGDRKFHVIAEALRAFVEVNDVTSHWPRATKMRLRRVDPMLYQYFE
jgi:hypothetical protein